MDDKTLAKWQKFKRRMQKAGGKLLIIGLLLVAAYVGVHFYLIKAGIPPPGAIHKAASAGKTWKFFIWLFFRPKLADKRCPERRTPLHYAAMANRKSAATVLLFWGADVDAKDRNGNTPLHLSTYKGRKEMTRYLIYKGAHVNEKNAAGRTPLETAIIWNRKECADVIKQYGGTR